MARLEDYSRFRAHRASATRPSNEPLYFFGRSNRYGHKKSPADAELLLYGAPGAIRTPDRLVRSQVLYPAELQALKIGGRIMPKWVCCVK